MKNFYNDDFISEFEKFHKLLFVNRQICFSPWNQKPQTDHIQYMKIGEAIILFYHSRWTGHVTSFHN